MARVAPTTSTYVREYLLCAPTYLHAYSILWTLPILRLILRLPILQLIQAQKISAFRPFFDKSSLDTHQDVIDGNEKLDEFPFCSSDESDDSELSFCKRSWIIPLILIFEYVVALIFNFFRKLLHCLPFVWIFRIDICDLRDRNIP